MKFSENTLAVLKNFATINSGVVLNPGQVQKTMSSERSILLEAKLEDDIPSQFGIYDLNQFLGNITTLRNPEITFDKDSVSMSEGDFTLTYLACSPNLIITPPADKELSIKTVDVKFTLTNASLGRLLKLAQMNNLPHLSVVGKEGALMLKIHEKANDTSNHGFTTVSDYYGKDFFSTFKTENLKLLPDDYDVELQIGAFAKFVNSAGNLKYFIAQETK